MNNKRSILNKNIPLIICISLIIGIFSCSQNKWVIEDLRTTTTTTTNSDVKYIVYFNPRIESNFTKSLSAFPIDCVVQVYCFTNTQGNQYIGSPKYESLTAGHLTPKGSPLIVPVGSYDFYATSQKIDTAPPSFINNVTYDLRNGIDYLWCGVEDQAIGSMGTTVDLTFTHCATQLVFNIINIDSVATLDSIIYASMSAPLIQDSIYKWSLLTGIINQAEAKITDILYLDIDSLVISGICMPFINDSVIYVTAYGENRNDEEILFTFSVTMPDSGYQAGHSYNYDVYYDLDSVVIGEAYILPWYGVNMGNIVVD